MFAVYQCPRLIKQERSSLGSHSAEVFHHQLSLISAVTQLENEDCGRDLHGAQMKLQSLSFQLIPVLSGDAFERVLLCLH